MAFPQALQLYTKLANAGNAEAQLHLGEMYWYGEAGAIDLVKADAWFKKSSAKGNKTAAASLEVMKKRELRRADIDYWVSKYDGADLKAGKFRCPAPRIPAISKANDEINSVAAAMTTWQDCNNGFVANLNASAPLTTRIPEDISKLLNKQELEAATAYLGEVHTRMGADASISAKLVLADYDAWRAATDKFVKEHNELVKSMPAVTPKRKYDN
ncbi:tetratricopeptide repeat protein [Massilia sp. TWR1-2-2]|uniref:tetratricopeptide repeat protein n=1 Tax=Massilia sp. TWR1-2-2 TaxID=2804584 RepID=UPI003CFA49D2